MAVQSVTACFWNSSWANATMNAPHGGIPLTIFLAGNVPVIYYRKGYVPTFRELMEETEWEHYGTGRHEQCRDCMVHCGYEASAVKDTFSSFGGFFGTVRATLLPQWGIKPAGKLLSGCIFSLNDSSILCLG